MIAYYELRVFNAQGIIVAPSISDIFTLSLSRARNEPGAFEITLPADYPDEYFGEDYIIEIWRSVDGRTFSLIDATCWFIRDIQYDLNNNGEETLTIRGHDTTGLLARHQVAWYSFNASADSGAHGPSYKTAPADTAIYEIWRENFGDLVGGTGADAFTTPPPSVTSAIVYGDQNLVADEDARKMPRDSFGPATVGIDGELGPVVELSVAWITALDAMKNVAAASATKGTEVWFDLVYTPGETVRVGNFEFKVWLNSRGANLADEVLLSPYHGTMESATWRRNYTEMANWIHVGAAGQGDLRLMGGVVDGTSVLRSPFYPIEAFLEAGEIFTEEAIVELGVAELNRRRAKTTVGGVVVQSPEFRFGRDYGFGDLIAAHYRGTTVYATIDHYSLDFSDGVEKIDIPLEGRVADE